MIRIEFFDNNLAVLPFKSQMWDLLRLCDNDFFPSLSSRENSPNGPIQYFEGLFTENAKYLLAFDEEQLLGFSIFSHNYFEDLISQFTPCNYIKIACVHPTYRGMKIASKFNKFLEEDLPHNLVLPYIVRRTWSTNIPQLSILKRNGYNLIHQFNNDRGNNISTVYFAKQLNNIKVDNIKINSIEIDTIDPICFDNQI